LRFEGERGIDLEIFNAPDLALELFDLVHLIEALDIPNYDCAGSAAGRTGHEL
jgi:hypothetical protein